mmetsp:Transcript_105935/g.297874  ORF Transcript_105935/g.297874 Transcript_105935/m.297874 type:complete len:524 (-) Transcript_105935:176-1747(-)
MRGSTSFACPNLSSIFRMAPPADPAVLDVARAIYLGGRAGGQPGLEAVAHIIQNRMGHPAFPRDPQAIIATGSEQFSRTLRGPTGSAVAQHEPQGAAQRQLFEQARRMAAQLVHPPRRLTTTDPTGGAIYYDERAPQRLHSASRPFETTVGGADAIRPSASAGVGVASGGPRGPQLSASVPADDLAAVVAEEAVLISASDSSAGGSTSPRMAQQRRPLSLLRDRRVGGSSGTATSPTGSGAGATSGVRRPPYQQPQSFSLGSNSAALQAAGSQDRALAHSGSASSSTGASSANPTGAQAGGGWLPASPPSPPQYVRAPPPSALPFPGGQRSRDTGASSGSAPIGSPNSSGLRLLRSTAAATGQMRGQADRQHGRPGEGGGRGIASSRGLGVRSVTSHSELQFGPRDGDGYHDVILPCGLLQDEVIDIMYRDLSPEDFEMLTKLDERLAPRNTAQRNLVERLPRVPVRECGCTECGVCLADFERKGYAVQLPCRHSFHPGCISKWLTQCKNTCPLCSAPIGQSA